MRYMMMTAMMVSVCAFATDMDEGGQAQSWDTFTLTAFSQSGEIRFHNGWILTDSWDESSDHRVKWRTSRRATTIGPYGKIKVKTKASFSHPTTGEKVTLRYRGRGFAVGGLEMIGQKRPTTMEMIVGKHKLADMTYHFDDNAVFSGVLGDQNFQIIQDGERVYVKNGFLQRTLLPFIPLGRFQFRLDGEVVGYLEHCPDKSTDIILEFAGDLDDATRGHLMASAMGFMMMADFMDELTD